MNFLIQINCFLSLSFKTKGSLYVFKVSSFSVVIAFDLQVRFTVYDHCSVGSLIIRGSSQSKFLFCEVVLIFLKLCLLPWERLSLRIELTLSTPLGPLWRRLWHFFWPDWNHWISYCARISNPICLTYQRYPFGKTKSCNRKKMTSIYVIDCNGSVIAITTRNIIRTVSRCRCFPGQPEF